MKTMEIGTVERELERELAAIESLVDQVERVRRADPRFAMNSEAIGFDNMDEYEDEEQMIDWILWSEAV